jgi:surfactin synthase thioesterase subunit
MKIAYLHGLESNINQNDPKIIFLNNNFNEVFTPFINYKDKNTFAKLFSKIKEMNPDIIVGSSMGGYFAYLIGSKLGIETLLFNPAVVSMTLDPTVDDTDLRGARHNVFLGKNDNVISGKDIRSYFDSNGVGNFKYRSYKGGHRVPEDTFINSIKNITGIKENDSSQINKIKYIKMKHIKTINELADDIKNNPVDENESVIN